VYCAIPNYKGVFLYSEETSDEAIKNKCCELLNIEPQLTEIHEVVSDALSPDEQYENINNHLCHKHIEKSYILDYYWSRQLLMYGPSFDKLRKSSVLIIGAGAIGNEVAKNLAMSGIGIISIVDPDIIENSNLSRTCLFRKGDIGKPKAEVLAEKIKEIEPTLHVTYFNTQFELLDIASYKNHKILVSCVDTFRTRVEIFAVGRKYDIPVFDAGARVAHFTTNDGWMVQIQGMTTKDDPCIACAMSDEVFENRLKEDSSMSCTDPKMPSDVNMHALSASILSSEILVYITGFGTTLHGRQLFEPIYKRYHYFANERNPKCPLCSKYGS